MLYTAVSFRWKEETRDNQKPEYNDMLAASIGFGMLDDDIDGRLQRSELRGRTGDGQTAVAAFCQNLVRK